MRKRLFSVLLQVYCQERNNYNKERNKEKKQLETKKRNKVKQRNEQSEINV